MASNIKGLDMVESVWVCEFLRACVNCEEFTKPAPSKAAANYIFETLSELGY